MNIVSSFYTLQDSLLTFLYDDTGRGKTPALLRKLEEKQDSRHDSYEAAVCTYNMLENKTRDQIISSESRFVPFYGNFSHWYHEAGPV